jgi:uncharacterized protein (DUF4415 family)
MPISKKRLKEITDIPDEAIDYSEIPELDSKFWKKAKLVLPERKQAVSLRLDKEIYEWFRKQGPGYQSRINAVLKSYMNAHKER